MRTYLCTCGHPVFFNNSVCISCRRALGFDPLSSELRGLDLTEGGVLQQALAEVAPKRSLFRRALKPVKPVSHRFCANLYACGCNWLIPAEADPATLCPACKSSRVIPDLSYKGNRERWQKLETAKRRLLFTLLELGLWGAECTAQNLRPPGLRLFTKSARLGTRANGS